jgi:hypothetical protein
MKTWNKIFFLFKTLEIQITFRQKWKDSKRIYWHQNGKLSQINLSPDLKIWKPDLFISNEIEGEFHNVLAPNTLLRLSPNGEYLYSVRITVKVFCPMDLKNYPFDQQICSIKIASCESIKLMNIEKTFFQRLNSFAKLFSTYIKKI